MTNARNIAERVIWTFVQGAIGAIPLTFVFDPHDLSAAERVGWVAVAGGIAAVISLAKNLTMAPAAAPTAVLAETLLPVRTASGVDHNPVPPLEPFGEIAAPTVVRKPKTTRRARNA